MQNNVTTGSLTYAQYYVKDVTIRYLCFRNFDVALEVICTAH